MWMLRTLGQLRYLGNFHAAAESGVALWSHALHVILVVIVVEEAPPLTPTTTTAVLGETVLRPF